MAMLTSTRGFARSLKAKRARILINRTLAPIIRQEFPTRISHLGNPVASQVAYLFLSQVANSPLHLVRIGIAQRRKGRTRNFAAL